MSYTNFRPGYLEKGQPLGATRKQVMLNADNLQIDCSGWQYVELSSDDTTASNRTFTLVQSTLVGHLVYIVFVSGSSTACQLADSGTVKLSAAWEPSQYDSLLVMWNGSFWIEVARSAATGLPDIPLTSGQILVGSSGNVAAAVAMSGDATIVAAGTVTIAAGAVGLTKLASAVAPSHVVKYAAQVTTVGGAAAEAFTVTGLAATDLVYCQIKDNGGSNVTLLQAVPTTNTLTVTFSADPGADTVFYYQALRATA